MKKIDFKKEHKELYSQRKGNISIVDVPAFKYLAIDGQSAPGSLEFQEAIEALFSLSYTTKFKIKKEQQIDYGVMPLEGLWWMDNMDYFSLENKDQWKWTAMIMQPEFISKAVIEEATSALKQKKDLAALPKVNFIDFKDGLSAQIMHIGPFADEGPTIKLLHEYINNNRYQLTGKHREIYLSDFRRCAPEKLKTIIRQPILPL